MAADAGFTTEQIHQDAVRWAASGDWHQTYRLQQMVGKDRAKKMIAEQRSQGWGITHFLPSRSGSKS